MWPQGKPTIVADFPYAGSGGFLVFTAGLRRTHRTFRVASTQLEDLAAVGPAALTCSSKERESAEFVAACDRVRQERTPQFGDAAACQDDPLQVAECERLPGGPQTDQAGDRGRGDAETWPARSRSWWGSSVVQIDFEELAAASEQADAEQARELAARWQASRANCGAREADRDAGEVGAALPGPTGGAREA